MPRTRSMSKQFKNVNLRNQSPPSPHVLGMYKNQGKHHYMNFSAKISKTEIESTQTNQEGRDQIGLKESRKKNELLNGLHLSHQSQTVGELQIQDLIKNISLGDKQSQNTLHQLDISYPNNPQVKMEQQDYFDSQVQEPENPNYFNTEVTTASSTFQESPSKNYTPQYFLKITLQQLKTYQIIKSLAGKVIMKNYGLQIIHKFQRLVSKNMRILFVPQPTNNLGVKLLTSGKFVIAYYFAFLKGERNPLIIDYILKMIEEQFHITEEREYLIGTINHNNIRKKQYLRKLNQTFLDEQVHKVERNILKR